MNTQTDYSLIQSNNIKGILAKHDRYLNHYAKSMVTTGVDFQDVKQDLVEETLKVVGWVNPSKIDENFNLKYFIFQKCNAYRKSQKFVQNRIYKTHEDIEAQVVFKNTASVNVEKDYEMKVDFPENCLNTELDRKVYFSYFIYGFKKKEVCEDCRISYSVLEKRLSIIKAELKKYL